MGLDPFKANNYQVGKILNAISSDSEGNLIFSDFPNPNGITLTQLINAILASNKNIVVYNHEYTTSNFEEKTYSFPGEGTVTGYEVLIEHELNLTDKYSFNINVVELSSGRKILPQEVIAVDVNSTKLVLTTPTDVKVSFYGA